MTKRANQSAFSALRRPYPVSIGLTYELVRVLAVGLVATLIMMALHPTGLSVSMIALIGIVCCAVASAIRMLRITLADEDQWTVGKEIVFSVLYLVAIVVSILCVVALWTGQAVTPGVVFQTALVTTLFAAMPLTLEVVLTERWLLAKSVEALEGLHSKDMTSQPQAGTSSIEIELPSSPNLIFPVSSFRYARARENYCELAYVSPDAKLTNTLIRLPLGELARMFEGQGAVSVKRCHRSWLVNLTSVETVTGNAQGYRLSLEGVGEAVPVSRKFGPEILRALEGQTSA